MTEYLRGFDGISISAQRPNLRLTPLLISSVDKETVWDGVHNPVALKNLRGMKPGDRLVIYETGERKSAVGTAAVVSVDDSDPKEPGVTIKAGKALEKPVTLAEIKGNKLFADSPLVRQGRLSVGPSYRRAIQSNNRRLKQRRYRRLG